MSTLHRELCGIISAFPALLSENASLKDLNGHQLAHKEIPKEISFFNQSGHENQYLFDHKSSADDGNDIFHPLVSTHLCEPKAFYLKNDGFGMICSIFDSKSPEALFNVSDCFGEGKNINTRRKKQAPRKVVEAEFHENYYSEIEFDKDISDNEASDEDLAPNQEIEDSHKTNLTSTASIFLYTNQTVH